MRDRDAADRAGPGGLRLEALPRRARALGFTIPAEAAVHVHFDCAPFRDARSLRSLVRVLAPRLAGSARCSRRTRAAGGSGRGRRRRTRPSRRTGFAALAWPDAQARLQALDPPLTKYCDVNLKNLVYDVPDKPTIEVRIFPGARSGAGDRGCRALRSNT